MKSIRMERDFIRCSAIPLAFIAGLLVGATGCSTMNNREKQLWVTGAAFAGGAAVGAATAPTGERKELHATYWGALSALGALLVSGEIFSDQKELERTQLENQKLNLQLDVIQNANTVLLQEGKGVFKAPGEGGIGHTSGAGLGPGSGASNKAKWRLYQTDKWIKDGPNRLLHQDKMVELIPLEGTK